MVNIGILGVGTISTALVTGFCTAEISRQMHFFLSPRNAEKAAALAEKFRDQVTVCGDNQQVIDSSDWVFLTVLPKDGEVILTSLRFRPDQKILTIMSDHPVERVRKWTKTEGKIIRMVPLPFAAMHIGPIAIFPGDAEVEEMFAPLGEVISLEEENELSVVSAETAIMSAFYHLIGDTVSWGERHGLPKEASLNYMTAFFEALSVKAKGAENGDAHNLAYEMTPGGLNEQTLKYILGKDGFGIWEEALDAVWERLSGKQTRNPEG